MKVSVLDDYQNIAASCTDWTRLPSWVKVDFFSKHINKEFKTKDIAYMYSEYFIKHLDKEIN